jgi:hypothetical protein
MAAVADPRNKMDGERAVVRIGLSHHRSVAQNWRGHGARKRGRVRRRRGAEAGDLRDVGSFGGQEGERSCCRGDHGSARCQAVWRFGPLPEWRNSDRKNWPASRTGHPSSRSSDSLVNERSPVSPPVSIKRLPECVIPWSLSNSWFVRIYVCFHCE